MSTPPDKQAIDDLRAGLTDEEVMMAYRFRSLAFYDVVQVKREQKRIVYTFLNKERFEFDIFN